VHQVFLITKIDGTDPGKPGPNRKDLCLIFFAEGIKAALTYQKKDFKITAGKV